MSALTRARTRLPSQPGSVRDTLADALLRLRGSWEANRGGHVPLSDPALRSLVSALARRDKSMNPAQQQDACHFLMVMFESMEDMIKLA